MPLRKTEDDYVLVGHNAWIGVKSLSIDVHRTDEGVVVDIYRKGHEDEDPVASTYAFFEE